MTYLTSDDANHQHYGERPLEWGDDVLSKKDQGDPIDNAQANIEKPIMAILKDSLGNYLTEDTLSAYCLGLVTAINLAVPVLRVTVSHVKGMDKSTKDIMPELEKAFMFIQEELSQVVKAEHK